jgi:hypothetical protein
MASQGAGLGSLVQIGRNPDRLTREYGEAVEATLLLALLIQAAAWLLDADCDLVPG